MEAVAVLKERYSPYNAHFAIKMDLLTYFPRKKDRAFFDFLSSGESSFCCCDVAVFRDYVWGLQPVLRQ